MQEYPKLLWRPDGREVTAHSQAEETALRADGCMSAPPGVKESKPPAETAKADGAAPVAEPEPDEADVVTHGGRKRK